MLILCGNPVCARAIRVPVGVVAVRCPKCSTINKVPVVDPIPASSLSPVSDECKDESVGWLIVHDELTQPQSPFPLRLGRNLIGRYSEQANQLAEVRIQTSDRSMSRQHCIIEVRQSGPRFEYLLYDVPSRKNPTCVNATVVLQAADQILLQDGDNLQLGCTSIRLKTAVRNASPQEVAARVQQTEYTAKIDLADLQGLR